MDYKISLINSPTVPLDILQQQEIKLTLKQQVEILMGSNKMVFPLTESLMVHCEKKIEGQQLAYYIQILNSGTDIIQLGTYKEEVNFPRKTEFSIDEQTIQPGKVVLRDINTQVNRTLIDKPIRINLQFDNNNINIKFPNSIILLCRVVPSEFVAQQGFRLRQRCFMRFLYLENQTNIFVRFLVVDCGFEVEQQGRQRTDTNYYKEFQLDQDYFILECKQTINNFRSYYITLNTIVSDKSLYDVSQKYWQALIDIYPYSVG